MRCPEIGINSGNLISSSNNSNDIILSIPNTAKFASQIIYENDTKYIIQADKLQKITISFTDDANNLINFNGISSYFTLKFEIYKKYIEKPPSFKDLVKNVNSQSIVKEWNNQK
jgi:hypothetical protein